MPNRSYPAICLARSAAHMCRYGRGGRRVALIRETGVRLWEGFTVPRPVGCLAASFVS
jgi:hypothetical protein